MSIFFLDTRQENILTLEFPSLNETSNIPSIILPVLRPISTGSCLHLEYRTQNIQLQIMTSSNNMTLLNDSIEWNFAIINIRHETNNYQVRFTISSDVIMSNNFTIYIHFCFQHNFFILDIDISSCPSCVPSRCWNTAH